MKMKYTPEEISNLSENEIFVFGSNPSGYHVGGAAKVAVKKFGACYGQNEGLQGQSYAIPTTFPRIEMIRPHIERFLSFAKENRNLTFYVTPIGCGNAGYTAYDIAPMFASAVQMDNVVMPESFNHVIANLPCNIDNPMNSWNSQNMREILQSFPYIGLDEVKKILTKTFHNTVQIINAGFYITENGKIVNLPNDTKVTNDTVFYSDEFTVNNVPRLKEKTIFEVTEKDCLKETLRLAREGYYPAVLNMASRQNPGGGVLKGSRAQEESIFRRTDLFRSLYQFAPYAGVFGVAKSEKQYPLDPNFGGVYSPFVTLFRDSEKQGCRLLETPEYINVISVAAMNRPDIDFSGKISSNLVKGIKNKMRTIFRIALRHRHDSVVLGAWGCGAYKNPPAHIAALFHEVLNEVEFKNKFRKIVFAIMEDHNSRKSHNPEGNLKPFRDEFIHKLCLTK